ncbi:hypothetical protein M0811_06000 [Anaeramoeba ignava]|uniref:Uncharacterized protein n=1 Tax=Anaeramoeba ignava TaxID=1746090 RepID=A0A9Q0LR30_ANAIG|nr:hypothetical protein M0811_06000 [Anaeramoeba ignava]
MEKFSQNVWNLKIDFIFHCFNLFGWFFEIGGLASFEETIQKTLVLYFLTTMFSLCVSIAMIVLSGFEKLGTKARNFFIFCIIPIIIFNLYGAQYIYDIFCLAYKENSLSCLTESRIFVVGATFSTFGLAGLLVINTIKSQDLQNKGYELISGENDPKKSKLENKMKN